MTTTEFPVLTPEDTQRCGIGMGVSCCAYLIMGFSGFECGREYADMKALVEGKVANNEMGAKRLPTEPYPECQLEDVDA